MIARLRVFGILLLALFAAAPLAAQNRGSRRQQAATSPCQNTLKTRLFIEGLFKTLPDSIQRQADLSEVENADVCLDALASSLKDGAETGADAYKGQIWGKNSPDNKGYSLCLTEFASDNTKIKQYRYDLPILTQELIEARAREANQPPPPPPVLPPDTTTPPPATPRDTTFDPCASSQVTRTRCRQQPAFTAQDPLGDRLSRWCESMGRAGRLTEQDRRVCASRRVQAASRQRAITSPIAGRAAARRSGPLRSGTLRSSAEIEQQIRTILADSVTTGCAPGAGNAGPDDYRMRKTAKEYILFIEDLEGVSPSVIPPPSVLSTSSVRRTRAGRPAGH